MAQSSSETKHGPQIFMAKIRHFLPETRGAPCTTVINYIRATSATDAQAVLSDLLLRVRLDETKGGQGDVISGMIHSCVLNKLDNEIISVEEMPREKKAEVPLKWIQTGAYVQTPIETRSLSAYLQDRLLFHLGWPTPDRADCPLCRLSPSSLDLGRVPGPDGRRPEKETKKSTNSRLPAWKEKQATWCWSHQYQIWTVHVVANLVTTHGGNVEAFQDAWKQHSASS